jgi:hypothetical protein
MVTPQPSQAISSALPWNYTPWILAFRDSSFNKIADFFATSQNYQLAEASLGVLR